MKGVIIVGFFGLIVIVAKWIHPEPKIDIRSVESMVSNGQMTMKNNEYNRLYFRVKTLCNQNTDSIAIIKQHR